MWVLLQRWLNTCKPLIITHYITKGQKPDHLTRCRKCKNLTSIDYKSPGKPRDLEDRYQHSKDNIQQSHRHPYPKLTKIKRYFQ